MKSDPRTWHVGQKVTCIDDAFPERARELCKCLPVKGGVYTVREIRMGLHPPPGSRHAAFLLEGLINPADVPGTEFGFWEARFEPYDGP